VRKDCINLIGNGVVAHVPTLLHELEQLEQFDPRAIERLRISSRAHVLLDLFQDIDGMLEAEKRGNAIGTTKRGIGPCYAAKATRNGIRFHDLLDVEVLEEKLKALIEFNKLHYPSIKVDLGEEMAKLAAITAKIRHCIVDSVSYIHESIARGDSILAEGANAALLDLDFGTYPFVTSSSTTVGGVCTGLGVNMKQVGCVVGVVKAYTTRVGHGPFPTELDDADGQRLGDNGHEYGTTTGRKRRCGWLDVPLVRCVCRRRRPAPRSVRFFFRAPRSPHPKPLALRLHVGSTAFSVCRDQPARGTPHYTAPRPCSRHGFGGTRSSRIPSPSPGARVTVAALTFPPPPPGTAPS